MAGESQVIRLMGAYKRKLAQFEEYLRQHPENAAEVEAKLQGLKRKVRRKLVQIIRDEKEKGLLSGSQIRQMAAILKRTAPEKGLPHAEPSRAEVAGRVGIRSDEEFYQALGDVAADISAEKLYRVLEDTETDRGLQQACENAKKTDQRLYQVLTYVASLSDEEMDRALRYVANLRDAERQRTEPGTGGLDISAEIEQEFAKLEGLLEKNPYPPETA